MECRLPFDPRFGARQNDGRLAGGFCGRIRSAARNASRWRASRNTLLCTRELRGSPNMERGLRLGYCSTAKHRHPADKSSHRTTDWIGRCRSSATLKYLGRKAHETQPEFIL